MFSRIKSLAQHTAVYGMGDLLGRAVSILLVPIYARHLTPADNGILSLAFAFIGFSAVFYSLGLNPALIRLLSGKTDLGKHRAAFSSAFWALFATGFILSSLVWTNAGSLAQYLLGSVDYSAIFELIAVVVLLDALSEPLFHALSRPTAVVSLCDCAGDSTHAPTRSYRLFYRRSWTRADRGF